MYLLLTDETNLQSGDDMEFFSYGGLIVSAKKAPELHSRISDIRTLCGYQRGDKLKFDTNARPRHISVEAAKLAKREVIAACIACECKFIAYVVLHAIAKNTSLEKMIRWGADHVVG